MCKCEMFYSRANSIEFDLNGNMIYSCFQEPVVNKVGINGINSSLLLNNSFTRRGEIFLDSKGRLWWDEDLGFVLFV